MKGKMIENFSEYADQVILDIEATDKEDGGCYVLTLKDGRQLNFFAVGDDMTYVVCKEGEYSD